MAVTAAQVVLYINFILTTKIIRLSREGTDTKPVPLKNSHFIYLKDRVTEQERQRQKDPPSSGLLLK